MDMQQQESVSMSMAHITTKGHMATSLVWAAAGDHVDVQGLHRAGPASHWLQHSKELPIPLAG